MEKARMPSAAKSTARLVDATEAAVDGKLRVWSVTPLRTMLRLPDDAAAAPEKCFVCGGARAELDMLFAPDCESEPCEFCGA